VTEAAFDLDRYLHALYPGHARIDDPARRQRASRTAADAFPDLNISLDYVFIKSRRRHTEQIPMSSGGAIVIDDKLSSLLLIHDTLLQAPSYLPESGLALMMVPYAEAFYREDAPERALLAATMALEHASLLRGMQKFAASLPGTSSIPLFLLLHEIAHFAVDSGQPFAQPRIGDVRQSLTAQLHAVRGISRRLEGGDALADLDVSFGPGSSPERETMTAQTKAYLHQIAGDEQVVREASCDFVALDGLARLRLKDCWDQDRQTIIGLTYREFADTLLIALRACRLLMGQEFLLQTVGNIVRAEDPTLVQKSFSHQMMRFNIITNLALEVFDTAVGSIGFSTPYRAGDPAKGKDPVPLMKAGMRRLHDLSIERVFNPIEQIGLYHRDPELYRSGAREASMKHFGPQVPPPAEMQGAVEALIEQFPF
jgi:hypothetical protein